MKLFIAIFSVMLLSLSVHATHNIEGWIEYRKINLNDPLDKEYEITIHTKTDATSPADRPFMRVLYGDEVDGLVIDSIDRSEFIMGLDFNRSIYRKNHVYPGNGTFLIQVEDPNRNPGIINMEESVMIPLFLESMVTITDDLSTTNLNSVKLLNNEVGISCLDGLWSYNPAAFDIDGDSLVYELVPCKGLGGADISSWNLPDQTPGFTYNGDVFLFNEGTIYWEIALTAGSYAFALKISEYKNGLEVGYVIKDFLVFAQSCNPEVPAVFEEFIADIEVFPWTEVSFTLEAENPNFQVDIEAYGGPLTEIINPASFSQFSSFDFVQGLFSWTPNNGDVRDEPYLMVFNTTSDQGPLDVISTEVVQITVLDPGANSVSELNSFDIQLYPNPVNNLLNIKTSIQHPSEYRVMNSSGSLVMSGILFPDMNNVDVSTLAEGVYALQWGSKSARFLKLN